MENKINYYELLGVESDASQQSITQAYRKNARATHPDTSASGAHLFNLIQQAYEVLRDPSSRAAYDETLTLANNHTSHYSTQQNVYQEQSIYEEEQSYVVEEHQVFQWKPHVSIEEPALINGAAKYKRLAILSSLLWIAVIALAGTNTLIAALLFLVVGFAPSSLAAIGKPGGAVRWIFHKYMFLAVPLSVIFLASFNILALIFAASATYYCLREWSNLSNGIFGKTPPLDIKEFGDIGGNLKNDNHFDEGAVRAGIEGEERTAEVLKQLLALPNVRIFHSLRYPGTKNADLDHAVVCGNKIAFIDSKRWNGSYFSWQVNEQQQLGIGAQRWDGIRFFKINFLHGVSKMTVKHKGRYVGSWVAIHGDDGAIYDNSHAPENARLGNIETVVEQIGNWFQTDYSPTIDTSLIKSLYADLT